MSLTKKQEIFSQEYIKNGYNGTQAYKKAYNCGKMKDKTINENASRLLKNSNVAARLNELKKPLQEKFEYNMEKSFNKLIEIQEKALEKEDLSSAIKCEELKGKLIGLYNDKLTIQGDIKTNVQINFIDKK